MSVNTSKVKFSLRGILKVAKELSPEQLEVLQPVIKLYRKLERMPTTSNADLFLFASAVQVLGQSLTEYSKGLGKPKDNVRNAPEFEYAELLLREHDLLPPVTPVDASPEPPEEGETEPPEEPESAPAPKSPPKKKAKTKTRKK